MPLTADQQAALRAQVRSDPACAAPLAARDIDALTAILSAGRTRPSQTEIGNGTIIDTIGLTDGTALLDAIHAQPAYKYVIPLLEQGRLKVGSGVVREALVELVAGNVLTQSDADALYALGVEPDLLSRQDVCDALFNPDGTEK